MALEAGVQLAPDSTGKDIRLLQVTTVINGVQTTVYMQVVALADKEGNPISLEPDRELLRDLKREARLQTEVLLRILSACDSSIEITRDELLDEVEESPLDDDTDRGEDR